MEGLELWAAEQLETVGLSAVLVAKAHPVYQKAIKEWAEREGDGGLYRLFLDRSSE